MWKSVTIIQCDYPGGGMSPRIFLCPSWWRLNNLCTAAISEHFTNRETTVTTLRVKEDSVFADITWRTPYVPGVHTVKISYNFFGLFSSGRWRFHSLYDIPYCVSVCTGVFTQHHVLTDSASLRSQLTDLWRSVGRQRNQRQTTLSSATRCLCHPTETQPDWLAWLLDHATRSPCGLSAFRDVVVTTSRALRLQVCGMFSINSLFTPRALRS